MKWLVCFSLSRQCNPEYCAPLLFFGCFCFVTIRTGGGGVRPGSEAGLVRTREDEDEERLTQGTRLYRRSR